MANWKAPFVKFWEGRAKIQQLAELTAVQDMAAVAAENQRNREAESAYVRKNLWGDQSKAEADDMGTTILGDVTHPTPIVINQQPQGSSALPIIAGMLASGLLGGGVAGTAAYMLLKQPAPVQQQQTFEDETLTIGLGRIENFKQEAAAK